MLRRLGISSWLYTAILIAALLAAVQASGVTIQNPFDVHLFPKMFVAGTSSLVSWIPTAEGTVSLKLFAGASRDMRYISTIAHFIDNKGSFAWTPSIALDAGEDYALLIVSDTDDQLVDCSPPFTIKRPIVNRQDAQSSYMSDSTPTTSKAAPTSNAAPTSKSAPTSAAATSTPATTAAVLPNSSTTSSPANGQTTSAATAAAPASSATSTQAAGQTSSSSGLSTGAAIGIGVGATLLVLLLIAVLAFFFLRRRRRQKREQPPPPDLTSSGPAELETDKSVPQEATGLGPGSGWEAGKPELEGGIMNPPMAELSSPPPLSSEEYAELERRRRAVELQGQSMGQVRAAELQGQAHPRAELEALRANARVVHELGGQDILHEFHPVYQR